MALSRAHNSTKAQQCPLITIKHNIIITIKQTSRNNIPIAAGMTRASPNHNQRRDVERQMNPDPDYHQILLGSSVAYVPPFRRILCNLVQ